MSVVDPLGAFMMAHDFGWGHLRHHDSPCTECDGVGLDDDGEECSLCNGDAKCFWGSFYASDTAECGTCHRDAPVAEMYEGGSYDEGWVCLPCYVAHHKSDCGCALWADAEARLRPAQART
jgi:hypothetical protein